MIHQKASNIVSYWSWFVHCIRNYYYKSDNKLFQPNEIVCTLHLHYRHHSSVAHSFAGVSFSLPVCRLFGIQCLQFDTHFVALPFKSLCVSFMHTAKYVQLITDQWSILVVSSKCILIDFYRLEHSLGVFAVFIQWSNSECSSSYSSCRMCSNNSATEKKKQQTQRDRLKSIFCVNVHITDPHCNRYSFHG